MKTLYIFLGVWIACSVTAAVIAWDKRKSFEDQAGTLLTIVVGSAILTFGTIMCHRNEPDF
jgi:hypothetical protein